MEGQAPPGMIYRHLRQLEEDGLVHSEWETEGTGPAKRMYRLTPEGEKVLEIWIAYMERQVENVQTRDESPAAVSQATQIPGSLPKQALCSR